MAVDETRLDRWLWAARIFKTRGLAQEAIAGGRVHLNGQRSRAAHPLRPGDRLEVSRGEQRLELVVLQLATRRGPASVARELYADRIAPENLEQFTRDFSSYRLDEVMADWKPYNQVVSNAIEAFKNGRPVSD